MFGPKNKSSPRRHYLALENNLCNVFGSIVFQENVFINTFTLKIVGFKIVIVRTIQIFFVVV